VLKWKRRRFILIRKDNDHKSLMQIPFFWRNFTAATGGFIQAVFSSEGVELVIIAKGN